MKSGHCGCVISKEAPMKWLYWMWRPFKVWEQERQLPPSVVYQLLVVCTNGIFPLGLHFISTQVLFPPQLHCAHCPWIALCCSFSCIAQFSWIVLDCVDCIGSWIALHCMDCTMLTVHCTARSHWVVWIAQCTVVFHCVDCILWIAQWTGGELHCVPLGAGKPSGCSTGPTLAACLLRNVCSFELLA